MGHISFKRVLQQLKADLIGKDSHRGVTLTYSWMANQFGHFSLGLIPSILVFYYAEKSALWASLSVGIFWFVFELYNFLGPLLKKKNKYVFSPKWSNLSFDTFTDLCFFWLGAFSFSLFVDPSDFTLLIVLSLIGIVLYPSKYWFLTKMYQFYAHYPFQLRLSQWAFEISDKDKETVIRFLESTTNGNHLFIFGPQKTGKTSLGVGIVNELSIQQKRCLYTSAIKLYPLFHEEDADLVNSHLVWTWRDAEFLVIDDINTGGLMDDLVSPEKFLSFIDVYSTRNRNLIQNKNIIWILGNEKSNEHQIQNEWALMLEKAGVHSKKITSINLQATTREQLAYKI